ncbi:MAG: type II secretion system protein GspD [Puniceicoccaceae bacterium]|nr:MAG: type II secretion system protein GspD [Puniceicoccaceae bacterium]
MPLSPLRPPRAVCIVVLGLIVSLLAGCQHSPREESAKAPAPPPPPLPRVSALYEEELRQVLNLARAGDWDEAITQAGSLYVLEPQDPTIQRVYNWVLSESERRQEKALEAEIRDIEARDSRFNPTLGSIFFDPRSRGLPLSNRLRNVLDEIDRTPLIPDSYGRVIEQQGRLHDWRERRGRMEEILEQPVTVQLDDVTLESIIFNIGRSEGINFVADRAMPAFQQRLSINLQDVPMREFLDYVSRNMNVYFQIGDNLVWVVDSQEKKQLFEETRFYRLRQGFVMPAQFGASEATQVTTRERDRETVTRTEKIEQFVRDGAPDEPTIEAAIKQFFTGSSYMIDYERNLIVARGTRDQLRVLEQIIEEFDQPVQQVLIEARFITVTEAAFLQLGVSWETGRDPLAQQRSPIDFTGFGTNVGLGLEETFTRVFGRENLSATLTALEQTGESQTLSAPRLTVINNRPARISDGKTQFYYEEYQVSQTILERRSSSTLVPKGRPTKLTSGVSLDVLASIGGDGESIMLALNPRVSQDVQLVTFATVSDRDEDGRLVSSFDIRLPESRDQELSTRVVVRSGETVVMGGVVEREQSTFTEAVPILGNIPILGAAFRKKTEFDQPRYLLIFVTATLLSERGEFIVRN